MNWTNLILTFAPYLAGFSMFCLAATLLLIAMGKIKV